MKEILLKRLWDDGNQTVGLLMGPQRRGNRIVPWAITLEQTYRGNKPDNPNTPENDASCIPPGRYVCKKFQSPKFGLTYEITGVPGRTAILFHGGDGVTASLGCVIVGSKFGGTYTNFLDGCVDGMKKLFEVVDNDKEFMLTVEPSK